MDGGEARVAKASGDFLPDLGHSDVALGAVVGEGDVGVAGESEHHVLVFAEGGVEVPGIGPGDAPALSGGSRRGLRKLFFAAGEDGSVAPAQGLEVGLGEDAFGVFAHRAA